MKGEDVIVWSDLKCEESRTYHFPEGESVTFCGVTRIGVSGSGGHRLEMPSGKAYVSPKWLWIDIKSEVWSL